MSVAAAVLWAAPGPVVADAPRFFDLKTAEASFEAVLKDAASGGFEAWMAGSAENPDRPVVLVRKGGWRFDPAASTLKPAAPTAAELEKVLRIVEDSFWNPGAATALGPDGTVAAYVLPKGNAGAGGGGGGGAGGA